MLDINLEDDIVSPQMAAWRGMGWVPRWSREKDSPVCRCHGLEISASSRGKRRPSGPSCKQFHGSRALIEVAGCEQPADCMPALELFPITRLDWSNSHKQA